MKHLDSGFKSEAAFDAVGRYRQDEVNGFSQEIIFKMLEAADLASASTVLDAMAGDGNLTRRLGDFCKERGISFPKATVLEYSRVQASFARHDLGSLGATVVWGNALGMTDLATGQALADASFDRVLVKSSNHEIPLQDQLLLYQSVLRVLRPGGRFVNLGMVFDDVRERDELREIARVKDTFAGMDAAVRNRHFLTRDELYGFLREAGFVDVRPAHALEYTIRSRIVAEQYFRPEIREKTDLEFQAAQVKAITLRRHGRLTFDLSESVMKCPGEITVARRPTMAETNAAIFKSYPMDFLRRVRAHAEMLEEAARHVGQSRAILDLGSGIGLLTEHLPQTGLSYLGLDSSPEFISISTERYGSRDGFSFRVADLNACELGTGLYDAACLLNTVHLAGISAVPVLQKAMGALRAGGRLIVSGPSSAESFRNAEPEILAQLAKDGSVSGWETQIEALREANRRILTQDGNYWSAEGMAALLRHLGCAKIVAVHKGLYYGQGWLVVAEK